MAGIPTYGLYFNLGFANKFLAPPPLEVDSTVAIVGTAKTKFMKYYASIELALAAESDYDDDSTAKQTLLDFKACATNCKVILSSYVKDNDANTQKTNALTAIEEINKSQELLGFIPTFIIAPGHKGIEYFNKLKGVADELRAIFFWETEKKTLSEIKTEIENAKSPRCVTTYQDVTRADGQNTVRPASAFILANWLKILFGSPRGLAETFSNKVINGITAVQDKVAFTYMEDKDANELRKVGVSTIVNAPDMRMWGGEVRDPTPNGFKVIKDQLIMDLVQKRLIEGTRVLIDADIRDVKSTALSYARAIMESLVARGIVIAYEVSSDERKQTPAETKAGRLWCIVKFQTNTTCTMIGMTIILTDEFTENILSRT